MQGRAYTARRAVSAIHRSGRGAGTGQVVVVHATIPVVVAGAGSVSRAIPAVI